jgi:hypothetical protein
MHEPIANVIEIVDSLVGILPHVRLMGKVDARNALLFPPLAKGILIVQQTQLLNDVVHDQVDINGGLVPNARLVGLAQLAHHVDVESAVRVQLQHTLHYLSQLWCVLLGERRKLAFCDPLEEIVQ